MTLPAHVGPRLEVRLDPERRKRLEALVEARDETVSEVIRDLIDAAHEDLALQRRMAAVERLIALGNSDAAEAMPDPEELSRQLGSRFDGPLPGFYDYGPVADDIDPVTAQKRR